MECAFRYNSNFKGIIDLLANITENITFQFNENGMNIQAMDGSHISLLYVELFIDQFTSLVVKKPITISLSTISLKPIIRSIKDSDSISMRLKDKSSIVDIILTDGDNINKYSLNQIYIDTETLDISSYSLNRNLIMTKKIGLTKILSDIKNTDADEVILSISENKIVFTAKSDLVSLKIKPSAEIMQVMNLSEDVENTTLRFNTKHLLNIPKILSICKPKLCIYVDNQSPLLLQVSLLSDVKNNDGMESSIRYYIAPKIDD
jgi:proliferating cell nuclear antigen